jgi:hypothetical protein
MDAGGQLLALDNWIVSQGPWYMLFLQNSITIAA